MGDGLILIIGEDGVARQYDDTYDIVIHCESAEEQDKVRKILPLLNLEKLEGVTESEPEPSVQPTLYGYKIEHLAYIARVMEKTGITAEQAAESFDDMGTAIRLLMEEITQKAEESVREMRRKE